MTPGTRLVTWLLSTITVVVLLFGYHTSTAGALQTGSSIVGSAEAGSTASGSGSSGSTVITGPSVQTEWGPVQVEITVEGGQITDVSVPVYPDDNPRDVEINDYALPILVQETLDQQSADIDMISGATVTSVGYAQSLQAALDEAGL